jgi:hypothetical protein
MIDLISLGMILLIMSVQILTSIGNQLSKIEDLEYVAVSNPYHSMMVQCPTSIDIQESLKTLLVQKNTFDVQNKYSSNNE